MLIEQYNYLQSKLKTFDDVEKLSEELGIPFITIYSIYVQNIVRHVKKTVPYLRTISHKLVKMWKSGKEFTDIGRKYSCPPVLIVRIILMHLGLNRKKLLKYLKEPDSIEYPRLRIEIKHAVEEDHFFSPKTHKEQSVKGELHENLIREWLTQFKIEFMTEDDIRNTESYKNGHTKKTPDFLLKKPFYFKDKEIFWIESKARFGDEFELRKVIRSQIVPYTKMFGNGITVYWYDYLENSRMVDGYFIFNKNFISDYSIVEIEGRKTLVRKGDRCS